MFLCTSGIYIWYIYMVYIYIYIKFGNKSLESFHYETIFKSVAH